MSRTEKNPQLTAYRCTVPVSGLAQRISWGRSWSKRASLLLLLADTMTLFCLLAGGLGSYFSTSRFAVGRLFSRNSRATSSSRFALIFQ